MIVSYEPFNGKKKIIKFAISWKWINSEVKDPKEKPRRV